MLADAHVTPLLRASAWSPLVLSVHATRGVSVSLRDVPLLANVPLPASWRPAAHWRLGFGARGGGKSAEHRLRALKLRSPLLPPF